MSRERLTRLYWLLLFVFLVGNILIYKTIFAPYAFVTSVLDVGEKGRAILVQTPDKKTILIDTGPDASILRALGLTLPPWQRTIDLVILTSNKKSSTGGLPDVLSRYKVLQQLTLIKSQRLVFSDNSYIDIFVAKNATTSISLFDGKTVLKVK